MKNIISILFLVFCSFVFTECNDDINLSDDDPVSIVKLTVRCSVSPILKDGDDDDEDPDPMFEITGSVTDGNGNPVEASVELVDTPENTLQDSTTTDVAGSYIFYSVPGGTYNVVAIVNGTVVDSLSITI